MTRTNRVAQRFNQVAPALEQITVQENISGLFYSWEEGGSGQAVLGQWGHRAMSVEVSKSQNFYHVQCWEFFRLPEYIFYLVF